MNTIHDTTTIEPTLSSLASLVSFKCERDFSKMPKSKWQESARCWKVRLGYKGRTMTVTFWTGSMHPTPVALDVISCMCSDALLVADNATYEDFAASIGYDTDSREGERTYKQCIKQTQRFERLLGDDFEMFLYAENDA